MSDRGTSGVNVRMPLDYSLLNWSYFSFLPLISGERQSTNSTRGGLVTPHRLQRACSLRLSDVTFSLHVCRVSIAFSFAVVTTKSNSK